MPSWRKDLTFSLPERQMQKPGSSAARILLWLPLETFQGLTYDGRRKHKPRPGDLCVAVSQHCGKPPALLLDACLVERFAELWRGGVVHSWPGGPFDELSAWIFSPTLTRHSHLMRAQRGNLDLLGELRTACRHTTRRRKTEVLHAIEAANWGSGTSMTCSTMRSEMQSGGSTARDGGCKLGQWDVDDLFNDAL